MAQQWSFSIKLQWLKSVENSNDLNKSLDKRSKIFHLEPFLDVNEIIQVGGRLEKLFLDNECKYLILLQKAGNRHHKLAGQSGQGITMNEIRSSGYWLLDSNSAVKSILYNFADFRIDIEKD